MKNTAIHSYERKIRPDDSIRNLPKSDQDQLIEWLKSMTFAEVLLRAEELRPGRTWSETQL